jgi:hypothetical protein
MGVDERQTEWLPSFGKWLGLGPFSIFIIEKKQRNIEKEWTIESKFYSLGNTNSQNKNARGLNG